MILGKKVTGIILIAGNSKRFGKGVNKNFELIKGKSILSYSLDAFIMNNYIDDISIVAREKDVETVEKIISKSTSCKEINVVLGGNSRQQSVYNAIRNIKSNIVIIHDGARPLIKQEYINNCLKEMVNFKGVAVGVKVKDTIKVTNDKGEVIETTERDNTWTIQTPQCFDRDILFEMHKKFKNCQTTDDCTLFEKGGYNVKIIKGGYTNIKVTTYEDISIIQQWI